MPLAPVSVECIKAKTVHGARVPDSESLDLTRCSGGPRGLLLAGMVFM